MSEVIATIAQVIYFLWPIFILAVVIYSFQGRVSLRALARRLRRNLLLAFLVLFAVWLVTLLGEPPNPTILPEPWNSLVFFGALAALLAGEASRLKLFKRRVRARIDLHHASALRYLKAMDPYDFEDLVAEVYRAYGHRAEQVGQSGDHGVDVRVQTRSGQHWVVQCKRYRDTVGESTVRELFGTMTAEKAHRGVLVTTAGITQPAEDWARGKPIDLVDGPALLRLIEGARQRAQGSWFDRLADLMESIFRPAPRVPSGLAPQAQPRPAAPRPARVPISSNGHSPVQYLRGRPICPNCGLPMLTRPPRPTDPPGRALYRCRSYPACRVVLEGGNQQTEQL